MPLSLKARDKRLKVKIGKIAVVLLLALISVFIFTANADAAIVYAADQDPIAYTGVLSDLKKDATFDPEDFPVVADDYGLQVIQIAESVNGELFVYVYQPGYTSKVLTASSINMSTMADGLIFANFSLRLISREGVFGKYVVENFKVGSGATRCYNISSILRPFDQKIDQGLPTYNENELVEVAFSVAKIFSASGTGDQIKYESLETEVITITDKYVGYVRYSNGFPLYVSAKCDSWYVAFSTDKPIDRLIEADVHYVSQSYERMVHPLAGVSEEYGEKVNNQVTLHYSDVAENPANGLFAKKYTWNRIETVDHFIANEDLTAEAKEDLSGKRWVLRFVETSYASSTTSGISITVSTYVSQVMILRLMFETSGRVYDLGVVDNKQSPPTPDESVPDNNNTNEVDIPDWINGLVDFGNCNDMKIEDLIRLIVSAILGIVLIMLLAPILPYILKFIVWVITLPFKMIAAIVKAIKSSKKKRSKQSE